MLASINYEYWLFWYFELFQNARSHILSLNVIGEPLHRPLPAHEANDRHRLRAGDQPNHRHVAERARKPHQITRGGYEILKETHY